MEQLIQRCKKNDRKAQENIFRQYANMMMSVCLRYIKDRHIAEERMLDGFTKFFTSLSTFQYTGEIAVVAYLKRIVINECLMYLRSKKDFYITPISDDYVSLTVDEKALDKMYADEIRAYVLKLPDGYRAVFNLYVIESYTHKEIAAILNITEGTSKSQLSKARALLQKMILENEKI